MKKYFLIIAALFLTFIAVFAKDVEEKEYKIQIKDHKFIPTDLKIPANQKVKLLVENLDSTIEEFESHDLNREKLVGGGKTISIFIGPLSAGTYNYFGDFHSKTAQGIIIVE